MAGRPRSEAFTLLMACAALAGCGGGTSRESLVKVLADAEVRGVELGLGAMSVSACTRLLVGLARGLPFGASAALDPRAAGCRLAIADSGGDLRGTWVALPEGLLLEGSTSVQCADGQGLPIACRLSVAVSP